jgi:hypothetical protein
MKLPAAAPALARLDDLLDRGSINPVKKWWWDIELDKRTGRYVQAAQTHQRTLQKDLDLRYEDQTLAVYPADKMPQPYPVTYPVNREEGIARYQALLTPAQYQARLAAGQTEGLAPPSHPCSRWCCTNVKRWPKAWRVTSSKRQMAASCRPSRQAGTLTW